jgi:hypothetical protein
LRLNPSPSDIEQVGRDLSDKDRQIVLEAALNNAVADGEIHPNEYAVVSELAALRIGADQFPRCVGARFRPSATVQSLDSIRQFYRRVLHAQPSSNSLHPPPW